MDNQNIKEQIFKLGSIEQIPMGQGRCFKVTNREVAVFRCRDGRLLAIANRCPHKAGGLSDGIVGDGKVVCPLHGHKFDLSTGKGSEPNECVKTYKVWQDGNGVVLIEFPVVEAVSK
jgi:nitrite reductase (NADH) small subunit